MTVATLRTERLVLRAPALRDSRVVTKALNDFAVSRWLTVVPFPYGMTDAEWFIKGCQRGEFSAWFIWAGDQFVGTIGLDDSLGYWIAQDAWGQGYATEAAVAVKSWARENLGLTQLFSYIDCDNTKSQAVAERLGAQTDGTRAPHEPEAEIWVHARE